MFRPAHRADNGGPDGPARRRGPRVRPDHPMLLLFDIDGTLIRTRGAGMRALEDAGRELLGPRFSAAGVDFAGSLDPVIVSRMIIAAGADPTHDLMAAIRSRYPAHLRRHLAERPAGGGDCGALPGVSSLLEALRAERPAWTLGLLTGNVEEGARLKLEHCGIDHDGFLVRVYGDDSPHHPPQRSHLPPVAMQRYRSITGRGIDPGRVLVIGDTSHDVACARAHGCRSLAVATGGHARAALEASGADLTLDTLADSKGLLKWMDGLAQP